MSPSLLTLLWIHSTYFLFTGLWPLLHMPSFLAVIGPKRDLWLVRTVAVLIITISLPMMASALRHHCPFETFLLAITSNIALMLVDLTNVATRTIPRIYLLDAAAEALLLLTWLLLYPHSALP